MSIIDGPTATKSKILIIDDEEDIREVLKIYLESERWDLIEASNGEEAIAKMKEGSNFLQVGLIICDIRMPKINGVETIEYLKREAPSKPILVITGYPDTELAVSLTKKGINGFLVKPVDKDVLINKVEEIMALPHNFQNWHGLYSWLHYENLFRV